MVKRRLTELLAKAYSDGYYAAAEGLPEDPIGYLGMRQPCRLCREVAGCGVEFDDPRIGYVTVQIDRQTWNELQAMRATGEGSF